MRRGFSPDPVRTQAVGRMRLASPTEPPARALQSSVRAPPTLRCCASGGDERGELFGGSAAHAREQVVVGAHRERRVGMAEAFGRDLDRKREAVGAEQRSMGLELSWLNPRWTDRSPFSRIESGSHSKL